MLMILAIDECGDFRPNSNMYNFYVCAHVRESEEFYQIKKDQFKRWESSIDSSLKNHKGEFKSYQLSNDKLHEFLLNVVISDPIIGITPVCVKTSLNPREVIKKHKDLHLAGINNGVLKYLKLGKKRHAMIYSQFANWYRKLSYSQFMKIILLGKCMFSALQNAIGHSISGGYDEELVDLRYLIDRIFLKGLEQNSFWHELIRNQLYAYSVKSPVPCLIEWRDNNHPFYEKYHRGDHYDLNSIFWENTKFMDSHENIEIRIADAICTILNRYWNHDDMKESYDILKYAFNADGKINSIVLKNFDFDYRIGHLSPDPWSQTE